MYYVSNAVNAGGKKIVNQPPACSSNFLLLSSVTTNKHASRVFVLPTYTHFPSSPSIRKPQTNSQTTGIDAALETK
jgi:hypothetical protein